MTDQDLLNQIKNSAEQIDIPASLAPDQMTNKLHSPKRKQKRIPIPLRAASSAAAVLLLCGILWTNAKLTVNDASRQNTTDAAVQMKESAVPDSESHSVAKTEQTDLPKKNAGSLYKVADSYEQINDVVLSASSSASFTDGAEIAEAEDLAVEVKMKDSASAREEIQAATGSAAKKENDFSTTNLQTEGVDESDIVKTDGRYIYTVHEQEIMITDTAQKSLNHVASIHPDLEAADTVLELYVDQNTLLILVQRCDTNLEESAADERYYKESDAEDTSPAGFIPLEGCAKINSIQADYSTILYVYDVTDPASPSLKGTASQDGIYQTSRKIDDIIYLFTRKNSLTTTVSSKDASGGILPCVNGREIPYDHVYLPEEGDQGLIVSSVSITNPEKILDQVMIVHNYVEIYVGTDSIYLYHYEYEGEEPITRIAKFCIENGEINAVDAASVKGEIYDTFAIHEHQNTLRVLTTSYNSQGMSTNRLYTFDENLKQAGMLDHIAEGEEIYAARYLGDTVYFITYRNTDPLFAVDLSDLSNPKLLGELKITGFSEYLHFWEDDKLLGIGFETDPDTGRTKGLKLVMFDISDPVNLKAVDSLTINNCYHSPALYNYKCILADSTRNLIGFVTECSTNGSDYQKNYVIYAWEDGHFTNKLTEPLDQTIASDLLRGLYINDAFYIASPFEIISYDMNKDFLKQQKLQLINR